ncbi:MAG: helix-turn-helix domain-containing protein [Vulcanimicrobiaceae bacterium]
MLLTVKEAASELRLSKPKVRALIDSGKLAAIAIPTAGSRRAFRVSRAALDTFLEQFTYTKKGGQT